MKTPTIGEFQQITERDAKRVCARGRRTRARIWLRVTALLCGLSDSELSALEEDILRKRDTARLAWVVGRPDPGN